MFFARMRINSCRL